MKRSLLFLLGALSCFSVLGCRTAGTCDRDSQCGKGQLCCLFQCKDVRTDAENCGACGVACSSNHGTSVCQAGSCQLTGCEPNFGDCNGDARDGCEADFLSSANACGSCSVACTPRNAQGVCSQAQCGMGACFSGYADCDQTPSNGCEVNVSSDRKNCGACGRECLLANAQGVCRSGACKVGACSIDFGDCNNDPADGCEVALKRTDAHCGACNHPCPSNQGCVDGECKSRDLLLFGGMTGSDGSPVGQTYRFDVSKKTFTEITAAHGPSARFGQVATWDSAGNRMLVYGGTDLDEFDEEIWALSFASELPSWSKLTTTGTSPGGRYLHSAAFDRASRKWYVFGGYDASSVEQDDLYVLDVATLTWSALHPTGSGPAARVNASAAFDAPTQKLVIFGGFNSSTGVDYADLWTVDTSAASLEWSQVVLSPAPAELTGTAFADGASPIGLFGGLSGLSSSPALSNDFWLLKLEAPASWTHEVVTPSPEERWFASAVGMGTQIVVYGGEGGTLGSFTPFNDLWLYDSAGRTWTELSANGAPGAPAGTFGASIVARQ